MKVLDAIGFFIGILIGIFIFIGIPILIGVFIANIAGLTGIYWYVLVIIIALIVNTILSMFVSFSGEVEENVEKFDIFIDGEGNLRDGDGNLLDEDTQRFFWELMKKIERDDKNDDDL